MSGRPAHATYDEERRWFETTLHAQVHILKDNHPPGREMAINSLGNLLGRVRGLRVSGQAFYRRDVARWTDKCNTLHEDVAHWRHELIHDPYSTNRVADDIEATMVDFGFAVSDSSLYPLDPQDLDDDPRRGDRSGAPSPEPVPK